MWDNIGSKLQSLAKTICWLGIIGSIIWAYLVLGCLASWIGSWALYGLGLVVEYVENGGNSARNQSPGYNSLAFDSFANKTLERKRSSVPNEANLETVQNEETSHIIQKGENSDWVEYGNNFVQCPQCGNRMSIDYITARQECPQCGCVYKSKST